MPPKKVTKKASKKKLTKTTKTVKKTTLFSKLKKALTPKKEKVTLKSTLTKAQALYLDSIEKQLESVPEGARGNGGLVVKENGKLVMKNFSTKQEALDLVSKIRKGELQLGQ